MPSDEQKDYKRALARIEEALGKLDKSKSYFEVKRIARELESAARALQVAKLAMLQGSNEPEPERKGKTLSDLNNKLFK